MKYYALIILLALLALPLQSETSLKRSESPYIFVYQDSTNSINNAISLNSTDVSAVVNGVIADVTVRQIYKNNSNNVLQASYIFPASTNAAVYAMEMIIGKKRTIAEIKEKDLARKIFNQAQREGKTASLLEQSRPNIFQMSLANILPNDEIIIEMKYTEFLIPTEKIYEFVFPITVGPRYAGKDTENDKSNTKPNIDSKNTKFNLNIQLNGATEISDIGLPNYESDVKHITNSKYEITLSDKDVYKNGSDYILQYKLAGDMIQSGMLFSKNGDENFFLLMVQPTKRVENLKPLPREYIFILDVSGSMTGYPLEIAKEMLTKLLMELKESDLFNVITFAGGSKVFEEESVNATEENLSKAYDFFQKVDEGGGTEMIEALNTARAVKKTDGFARSYILITDGYVTVEPEITNMIANDMQNENMFPFGIGTSVNRHLMESIAAASQSEQFITSNKEEAYAMADRFYSYINNPLMTDISYTFGGGFEAYDVYPKVLPDLLADRPILLYGKFKGEASGKIFLKGKSGMGKYEFTTEFDLSKFSEYVEGDGLKYIWARNQLKRLELEESMINQNYNSREKYADKDYKNMQTELALKYNLLSKYTSFVAVDPEQRVADSVLNIQNNESQHSNTKNELDRLKRTKSQTTQVGTIQKLGQDDLESTASNGVNAMVATAAGVTATGQGFTIRGARPEDEQVRIDGLEAGNQFSGGYGVGGDSMVKMSRASASTYNGSDDPLAPQETLDKLLNTSYVSEDRAFPSNTTNIKNVEVIVSKEQPKKIEFVEIESQELEANAIRSNQGQELQAAKCYIKSKEAITSATLNKFSNSLIQKIKEQKSTDEDRSIYSNNKIYLQLKLDKDGTLSSHKVLYAERMTNRMLENIYKALLKMSKEEFKSLSQNKQDEICLKLVFEY